MKEKHQKKGQQANKYSRNVNLVDSDNENNQNQFQNILLIGNKPSQQQQQQVMSRSVKQKRHGQHIIIQIRDQEKRPNDQHYLQRQFQQIRFNSLQCNLMDMDVQVQGLNKPNSSLTGFEYEKFVENRSIFIQFPQLINQGYITSYKLYQIKTKISTQNQYDTCVSRRFSDFEYLNQILIQNYGGFIIPILPDKNFWAIMNLEGKQYREVRTKSLNKYLNRFFRHKKLRYCQEIKSFLFQDDAIFSSQKGEHTQKKSQIQEKIKQIGTGAFYYGKSLFNKIMNHSADSNTKLNEQIRLSKNKLTKEDLTLSEYQIIVSELIRITKQLKVLVQNTIQQMKRVDQLEWIFSTGLSRNRHYLDREKQQRQHESVSIKIQNDNLYQEFEDMCEFIQSCLAAIQRRNNLRSEIQALKEQEQLLVQKYKTSPRSLQLDIIRSKLNKLKKMNQNYAQQLIKELQLHADQGKGMLKQFVSKFEKLKAQFFSNSQI